MLRFRFLPVILAAALGLAGASGCPSRQAQPPPELPGVDGRRALAVLERLVAPGPRTPGSEAAAQARLVLEDELGSLGVAVERQLFQALVRGRSLAMVNLWARIPGERPDHVIVLGTHYDTKIMSGHPDPAHNFEFQGANDGGAGSALLVELARHVKARSNRSTFWLVWFDGEESIPFHWDDREALFGSRHFVAELKAAGRLPLVKAMVLLDLVGHPDLVLDNESLSDPRLRQIVAAAARRLGVERRFFAGPAQEIRDDHYPFLVAGIPAVNLIGLGQLTAAGIWHTPRDTIDRVSPDSLALVGRVVLLALEGFEAL